MLAPLVAILQQLVATEACFYVQLRILLLLSCSTNDILLNQRLKSTSAFLLTILCVPATIILPVLVALCAFCFVAQAIVNEYYVLLQVGYSF